MLMTVNTVTLNTVTLVLIISMNWLRVLLSINLAKFKTMLVKPSLIRFLAKKEKKRPAAPPGKRG